MIKVLIYPLSESHCQRKIKNTKILLVGVGGVGGFAYEALIRSGFQNITIIDNNTDVFVCNKAKIALPINIIIVINNTCSVYV